MRRVISTTLALFVATSPSVAQNSVHWKDVNGWNVFMDPSMGNACYVTTSYEDGTILRLGFNFLNEKPLIYFALGNRNWKSLEEGKDYPVEIQFDSNAPWDATAFVTRIGETNFINATTTDTNFADEFARKHSVRARFKGRQIAALRLKGSAAAIREFLECQRTVNSVMSKSPPPQSTPKDPFQATPDVKSATDPFDL